MMLGDNNKNSGESILLFGKSIFLFLKSFYWRKMDWISFYFLSLQSHSAEVHLSNNITRYIFWWDMFCSKSITHGLFINFFFQGAFLFFFRRMFYLSTRFLSVEPWILCHLPSCFRVSVSCSFLDAVNMGHTHNTHRKWQLTGHLLQIFFQCVQSN